MNVVGNVLGTPGKSNRYEALPGQPYDDWKENVIWALGVVGGVHLTPMLDPRFCAMGISIM